MGYKTNTAIIPVAGFGSRMLPVAKAVEKCMLPILNRPIIDYVVQDCLIAGIERIIFIVGDKNSQVEKYYSKDLQLEDYLSRQGKEDLIHLIEAPQKVEFCYIVQNYNGSYGSAIPVALAYELVKNEPQVLVLMGDDFIWYDDHSSECQHLIDTIQTENEAALLGVEIELEKVSNYGVIKTNQAGLYEEIVEKPLPADAPSNLINVSKYLLPQSLLSSINDYTREPKDSGEYIIIEPINKWVKSGGLMRVCQAGGQYLDGGNLDNWLAANNFLASRIK
jgi:UTP--glucose-1-phosphate uridylyltransferase